MAHLTLVHSVDTPEEPVGTQPSLPWDTLDAPIGSDADAFVLTTRLEDAIGRAEAAGLVRVADLLWMATVALDRQQDRAARRYVAEARALAPDVMAPLQAVQ